LTKSLPLDMSPLRDKGAKEPEVPTKILSFPTRMFQ
jgi:hypothetical protein